MSAGRKVVRNSIFGIISEGFGGALNFAIIIIIARLLGTSQFGVFSYILALVGIFQLVADFGLTNVLVREIARELNDAKRIIDAVRPLVWAFSLVIFVVLVGLAWGFSATADEMWATVIMAVAVLAVFHAIVYGSVCRAFEDMGYNAVAFSMHKVLLLGFVLLALLQEAPSLTALALAYLAANVLQWLFFFVVVRRRYIRVGWRIDVAYWKYLLKEAFPIGAAMVFRRVTLHVDTLLLTAMSTASAVGLFNAAYKIIQMVDMIPFTLSIPLFPPFTRLARESHQKLFDALVQALRIFAVIALPIFVWLLFTAHDLVYAFFGEDYAEAAAVLRVLAAAVVFLFPTALFIYVFSALNRQKYYTLSAGICLATNVVLDVALIPWLGYMGAAYATLVGEIMFFVTGVVLLRGLGCVLPFGVIVPKPAVAAVVASVPLYFAVGHGVWMVLAASVVFVAIYGVAIVALRAVRPTEITMLRDSLRRQPKPAEGAAD